MINLEQLKKYVENNYGYNHGSKETNHIAERIYEDYDNSRIEYAVNNNVDIYDLDRWESAINCHKAGELRQNLEEIGYKFTEQELDEYLKDFPKFIKHLVDPLYEDGHEIIEITQ